MIQLQRVIFPKIHSSINIQTERKIQIENSFNLNINFDLKDKKCISTLTISSQCKEHLEWFDVSVTIIGIFTFDEISTVEQKKQIHSESYDMLFPYIQSVISDITAKAGLPAFMLEKAPINFDKIIVSENE